MISIIVSTYKPENFQSFSLNVQDTIGDTPYEIIKIDNPGLMGICGAYNKGLKKAKFSYICFSHDDILFRTQGWGQILISSFADNVNLGLIGCAGSTYKAWVPSGWSSPRITDVLRLNFIQTDADKTVTNVMEDKLKSLYEVASLDGCWLCTKKEVTDRFQFDENLFKSYHCYDVDFSLQVESKYQIAVTSEILIEHCSRGNFSLDWLKETYKLHGKWERKLPMLVSELSKKKKQNQEVYAYSFLLDKTLTFKECYRELVNVLFSLKLLKLVGLSKWFLLLRWTIVGMLKNQMVKK